MKGQNFSAPAACRIAFSPPGVHVAAHAVARLAAHRLAERGHGNQSIRVKRELKEGPRLTERLVQVPELASLQRNELLFSSFADR